MHYMRKSNRADRKFQGINSPDTSPKTCKPWEKSFNRKQGKTFPNVVI